MEETQAAAISRSLTTRGQESCLPHLGTGSTNLSKGWPALHLNLKRENSVRRPLRKPVRARVCTKGSATWTPPMNIALCPGKEEWQSAW